MSLIFASALKSVGKQRARLQKTQADWIRVTRNGCNDDDSCLTDVYQRRIAIVRSIDNRGSIEPERDALIRGWGRTASFRTG